MMEALSMLRRHESTSTGPADPSRHSGFARIGGELHASIRHVDRMPPFLMNVVGNGDVWMFVGSNGGITAGRRDPDLALFPYQTVDKLLAAPDASGAVCLLRVEGTLWEPGGRSSPAAGCQRHLHKHEFGTSVVFEEINEPLGLRLRWQLAASETYGVVRHCTLKNIGRSPVAVRSLDGWHQLLAPGVGQQTYERYSYLAAAYMRHELLGDEGLMVSALNAAISDRPLPAESLRAGVAWSFGHHHPVRTLDPRGIGRFRGQAPSAPMTDVRGEFGCYLVEDSFTLAPGTSTEWFIIADTGLDHAAVVRLRHQLVAGHLIREEVAASLASNAAEVRRRVAAADGLQASADRTVAVHHFSNTLFNIMRGGVPADGYRCPRGDLSGFVARRNAGVHARHREWLEADGDRDLAGLAAEVADRGDPHLRRIVREYLPMCFGRRHGDPSRPWNRFSIATRDPLGRPVLGYSGNWRDIFQNWEALSYSHPGCLPGMVAVFLNASTVDGYNPYRITRDGIDWEVADASDPWSHIGYWGDHQIVYLLRLLEAHERFWPGRLAADLDTPIYAAAVVPYRISGFDDLLRDPRHSIAFDKDLHQSLRAKMAREGGDGALATAGDGAPRLYSLAEKLLVPALVKLSNLVPDGGIWLNTQRPEWNDANNALAGWGLSVVTVCHLRRHLRFLDGLVAAHAGSNLRLTAATADLVEGLAAAVASGEPGDRFAVFEALGRAGEQHRDAVYAGGSDERREVSIAVIRGVLAAGGQLVDDTIRANRRPDGMYHSYNRLDVLGRRAEIHHFELMLEGQVAVLSSGLLDDTAALKLLAALRASPLYREDQRSYLLQPDRDPVPYLERNRLPADWSTRCPGLAARVAAGATDVVVVDIHGDGHFHADIANATELAARLVPLGLDEVERTAAVAVWEDVFHHAGFTGRSGSFFAFEGLGSIYWHMVAKLLLAVQECHGRAAAAAKPRFRSAYREIRDGLGFRKSPQDYGAFPTDAYSHTPRHAGAQQPGMTGQVKEEILTRLGELGVAIEAGCLRFRPELMDDHEFGEATDFEYVDLEGLGRTLPVAAGGLAFTFCQVPVIYEPAAVASVTVFRGDAAEVFAGDMLPGDVSRDVFHRAGRITRIVVGIVRQPGGTT